MICALGYTNFKKSLSVNKPREFINRHIDLKSFNFKTKELLFCFKIALDFCLCIDLRNRKYQIITIVVILLLLCLIILKIIIVILFLKFVSVYLSTVSEHWKRCYCVNYAPGGLIYLSVSECLFVIGTILVNAGTAVYLHLATRTQSRVAILCVVNR